MRCCIIVAAGSCSRRMRETRCASGDGSGGGGDGRLLFSGDGGELGTGGGAATLGAASVFVEGVGSDGSKGGGIRIDMTYILGVKLNSTPLVSTCTHEGFEK